MSNSQQFSSPDRISLLLDFPIRLYTALRTMRLYPASNPQVHRSNDFVLKAFKALQGSETDHFVNIALSDQKILICGEHLPDRDQARPQVQGLITLFSRLKIHSFTFHAAFDVDDCVKFIQILSDLLGEKELKEPVATLLDKAGIDSISVDAKRYVAIHNGEQVVRDELIGSGLNISDGELANYVMGKAGTDQLQAISPELVKELISRLPEATVPHHGEAGFSEAIIEVLKNLSKETDINIRTHNIQASAATLSGIDPALLSRLVAHLPTTPVADEILSSTLHQLTPQQLNALIISFVVQQSAQIGPVSGSDLHDQASNQIDVTAFNRMLAHYEKVLTTEQQTQVAQQVGTQLASMGGMALGNIIAQKFTGLFGERLYRQIITQVSDEQLEDTVAHLPPKQLNQLIATLTNTIPFPIDTDKDPGFNPVDDALLKRLTHTSKGAEITRAIAQNSDAHVLQAAPDALATLPEPLARRLQQPAWSAPILVTAAQQSIDPANYKNGVADFSSFKRMLDKFDTLLNQETQLQVATQAGCQLASFDEKELGLILVQKYKNLFGDQLYQQVINQLSDEKFEKLANQLQAVTENHEALPLDMQDQDIAEAYKRLLQTVRGEKMRALIENKREQETLREQERQQANKGDLDNLLQGGLKGFEKKEFYQTLPETVSNLLNADRDDTADTILMQLAVALQHKNLVVQDNSAVALAAIAEQLADIGQWQRLDKLLPALKQGLQLLGDNERSIHQTMTAFSGLISHYLIEHNYTQALDITNFLRVLSTENPQTAATNPQVREQALQTMKGLCSQPVMGQLLDLYLHSDDQQETAAKLLVAMGRPSAEFQLQQLMSNESRFERKRLLSLFKQTGTPSINVLLEQLHKDAPWFVIRNIIHLLGELGNPSLIATIQPFIGHADLRVQQEVINTAVKICGGDLNDFLLDALQTVADPVKIKVVHHVATTHDRRFVRPLTDLLESHKPFLGKNKNDLQLAICKALGMIGSKRATTSLNKVVQSKNILGLGGASDEVRQAAGLALEQIRKASSLQKGRDTNEEEGPIEVMAAIEAMTTAPSVAIDEESKIFTIAAQGNRDQAKKRLLDLITTTARAGDFKTAERLRERIYEIDSLALGEIIRSGEIIEQEKKGAIKEDDLEAWEALTDRLSSEEFSTIYHEFTERRYNPEETLVSQGDKNDTLFFIAQGSVKVSHSVGPREIFITSLNRGQIAGENFFAPSVWTVSLTSLTPSKVYILPQTAMNVWQERFPGLRAKLYEFYTACDNIQSILQKKRLDRRNGQRFDLSRKIQVQPITNLDSPIGRGFRAEIIDISQGGLAFLVRITRQENTRLLLGRRMQVVLPIGGETQFLDLKGLVVSIRPFHLLENDYSVHFKFDHPLEPPVLQTILG